MDIQSEVLSAIFHEDDDRLTVSFANGRRYAYFGVPAQKYHAFTDAAKKSSFFQDHILGRYPFARIEGAPTAR